MKHDHHSKKLLIESKEQFILWMSILFVILINKWLIREVFESNE